MLHAHRTPSIKLGKGLEEVASLSLSSRGAIVAWAAGKLHRIGWPSLARTGEALDLAALSEAKTASWASLPLAHSPDGSRLAIGAGTVGLLCDASTMEVVTRLPAASHPIQSLAYSADGARLAAGSYTSFRVHDARTGSVLAEAPGATRSVVHSVAFSADGALLATRSYSECSIWDARTLARIADLIVEDVEVSDVAFLPDGGLVTSASASKLGTSKLGVWRAGAWGAPAVTANVHRLVPHLAVASSAGTIVSGGRDDGVRLWTPTLEPIATLHPADRDCGGVAISADARAVVAAVGLQLLAWSDGAAGPAVVKPPTDAKRIAGARALRLSSVEALHAFIEETRWLANVGLPLAGTKVKRLASYEEWKGPEDPANEPIVTMPHGWIEDAKVACRALGVTTPVTLGESVYSRVYDLAAKVAPAEPNEEWSSPRNAALGGAAHCASAAAMWLSLGWSLPSDLQTLLAWFGDGRWPCGLARAPRGDAATPLMVF